MWPLQEQLKKHFLLEDSKTDEGDFKDKNQPTQMSQRFAQVWITWNNRCDEKSLSEMA